jgi:hypothetical protein
MNTFNLPSVDHLIEGVHYNVIDWSFAEGYARDRGLETNMPSRGMPSTFEEEKVSWVMKDGKPVLASAVKDEAPAAPSKGKKNKQLPKGATQSGVSQSSQTAQVRGTATAFNKQANNAGRQAQMRNLQKIQSQRVNPG